MTGAERTGAWAKLCLRGARGKELGVLAFLLAIAPGACSSGDDDGPVGAARPGGSAGSAASAGTASSGRGGSQASGGQSASAGGSGGAAGEPTSGGASSSGDSGATNAGEDSNSSGRAGAGVGGDEGTLPADELCGDGDDNDGDGRGDCEDDDCAQACASCDSVPLIDEPSTLPTSNVGRPAAPPSDCVAVGPALIYEVLVQTTGVLEVEVEGFPLVRTSILAGCDDEQVLACGSNRASAAVTAAQRRFVRVAGLDPEDAGELTITVHSRPSGVCGDGYHDLPEGCDDGGRTPGDGCDANCAVELDETEPNQTRESADTWAAPFFAEIAPEGDEDFVGFDVEVPGTLVATTLDLGADACANEALDSLLELFDASGDPLAADDDGGDGYCAELRRPNTQAGRYYLRVTASPTGVTPTFPYQLAVSIE